MKAVPQNLTVLNSHSSLTNGLVLFYPCTTGLYKRGAYVHYTYADSTGPPGINVTASGMVYRDLSQNKLDGIVEADAGSFSSYRGIKKLGIGHKMITSNPNGFIRAQERPVYRESPFHPPVTQTPFSSPTKTGHISVGVWYTADNFVHATYHHLGGNGEGGANGWNLLLHDTGTEVKLAIYLKTAVGNFNYDATGLFSLHRFNAVGETHHFAFTFDGRYIKGYVDGKLDNTVDIGVYTNLVYNSFQVGTTFGESLGFPGRACRGTFNYITVHDRALTQAEVRSLATEPHKLLIKEPLVVGQSDTTNISNKTNMFLTFQ